MISTVSLSRLLSPRFKPRPQPRPVAGSWFFGMLSILLVTAIWGYSNVVIRQAEFSLSPVTLLWMRFGLAALIMTPLLLRVKLSLRDWLHGLSTGVLLGLSVLALGFAMKTIPVDQVAFIAALYVVLTPMGVSWLQRKWPPLLIWIAVLVSLGGVALLTGGVSLHQDIGLIWAFLAAVGLSGQIIGTTALTRRVTSVQLSGLQSVGAGLTLTVIVLFQGFIDPSVYHGLFNWSWTEWLDIGYLAIPATVVACFLQAWGQTRISATEAALAFNMEPVWTAIFAWMILSQRMTVPQWIGALLIVSSLTLVSKPGSATARETK